MRLKEMLQIPAFAGFRLVAGGGGLEREVSTVSVMDAPDIYEWMRGGEFLITSGYVIRDDPEYIAKVIEKLDEWGASAFGIKVGRFIDSIPQSAIETAERLNFPLLALPTELAFTEVINPVLQEVINCKSREMIYTENIHREFIRMAIEEKSITEILQMLAQYISRSVVYFDANSYRAYFSDGASEEPLRSDALAVMRRERSIDTLDEKYPHYPVKTNSAEYGCLFFGEQHDGFEAGMERYYQITIEQASIVLIIKVQKLLAEKRIEGDYREFFVEDLINSNFRTREEIANRARIYGWDFPDGGYAVILNADGIKENYTSRLDKERGRTLADIMERLTRIAAAIINQELGHAVYRWASDQTVFAISSKCESKEKLYSRCREVLQQVQNEARQQLGQDITIGVGSYKPDFYSVSESYREAGKAIDAALEQGKHGSITIYDELGVMKLLSRVSGSDEARELCAEYVEKLRSYDAEHGSSLLQTMQVIANCEWNLKRASEQLYIHYNSVKYRYRKACQILEKDLSSADQKLNMEIALKLAGLEPRRF